LASPSQFYSNLLYDTQSLFYAKEKITVMSHSAYWIFFISTRGMWVQHACRAHCKLGFCCQLLIIPRLTFVTLFRQEKLKKKLSD